MKIIDSLERGFIKSVLISAGNLEISGQEHIPPTGPYILVVNHMSKADPALLFYTLPKVRIRFFAGEKWENHLIFGPLLRSNGAIYINRGEVDRKALREALDALRQGAVFGLAPEGTRSRIGSLIRARDGAAYLATRARVPVLPVGISNTDWLGHNMSNLKRTTIEMKFGKPFRLPDIQSRPKGAELAAYTHLIMIHIATLLDERHWGYYASSPALKALLGGQDPWPFCLKAEGVTAQAEFG